MPERLTARTVRLWGERYSNWGRWGSDDQRGTLNLITPAKVLTACQLPRRGQVISCALPFDEKGPQTGAFGRHNPIHVMLADGADAAAGAQDFLPGGFRYADDAVTMPLQCGTQWDALAHVFYDGRMYNDRDVRLVTSRGARANSIDRIADGVVSRGILLDLPRHRRVPWLEDGTPILPEELDDCAEAQGVAVEPGDVVLVRTGKMTRCLEARSWEGYTSGPAPGLSVHCARWLHEREVAAVATDTFALEVLPSEVEDCLMPLHMISLRNTGVLFGEIFHLDRLAAACAEDGSYAFLFCAPPLPVTGAVGSPINTLAVRQRSPDVGRLAALFLVSGAAALVVETTWLRWFRGLFGATAPAASATLVAFFAGHALGAALAARRAATWRRPLRVYALLEAGAAAGALAVPGLLAAGEALTAASYDGLRERPALLTVLRFALALAATLPASAALGATLPAVGAAALARARQLGVRGSALYGWNTLGAALGAAGAAFWLPVWVGVPGTYGLAVALQLGVAALALAWSRRAEAPPLEPRPPAGRSRSRRRSTPGGRPIAPGALLGFAGLSGCAALAAQVLLVEAFGQVLNQSVQAFGAVLVVVLAAMAAGAAGVSLAVGRGGIAPGPLLGWGLALAAVAAAGFPAALYAATGGLELLGGGSGGPGYGFRALGLAATAAGPLLLTAALALPACFALAGAAEPPEAPPARAGALLGRLSAANTAGAIAGALLAPFALLPALGLWGAFGALAALLAGGALLAPGTEPRERRLRLAVLGAGGAAVVLAAGPQQIPLVRLEPGERLVAARTTPAGVVAVVDRPDGRIVRTDNHYVLGGTAERVHEERQGHLPLLLHPEARRVVFVGTATGITAGAATVHPLERLFLVELVPAVTEAARAWFADANRDVYADPRAVPVLDDARNFLRATSERFDLVVADLFVPWRAGTGSLYTREHFSAVRAHLRPDGLFCQWLPLYQLRRPELESVMRTFLEVFPRAALFRGDFYGRYPIAALVGWAGEPAPAAAVEGAAERLAARGVRDRWVTDPAGVWALYVGSLAPLRAALADVPLNTEAWPRVEFEAGRGHPGGGRGVPDAMVGARWLELTEGVGRAGRRGVDPLYGELAPAARRAREGGAALQTAGVHWTAGRREEATRALEAAARLLPERLFLAAPADPTAADVWHALDLPSR